jgi:hypothetical protein
MVLRSLTTRSRRLLGQPDCSWQSPSVGARQTQRMQSRLTATMLTTTQCTSIVTREPTRCKCPPVRRRVATRPDQRACGRHRLPILAQVRADRTRAGRPHQRPLPVAGRPRASPRRDQQVQAGCREPSCSNIRSCDGRARTQHRPSNSPSTSSPSGSIEKHLVDLCLIPAAAGTDSHGRIDPKTSRSRG